MFDTTKTDLQDILKEAQKGNLQLPEFQRSYVWNDDDVKSLIASVIRGFPIGALLTLETGGEIKFKPRVLEGILGVEIEPTELLLDGQQRITSLFQALYSEKPVKTKTTRGTIVERFYYLDMAGALDNPVDIEDSIIGVPGDKILKRNFGKDIVHDLTSKEKEFEKNFFPLNLVFDNRDWFYDWRDYWRDHGGGDQDLERDFVDAFVRTVESYKIPIIKLDKSNSREAICLVFEKVNVGGKKLDAFELLTAIYASDEFDLRKDWLGDSKEQVAGRKKRMLNGGLQIRDVLRNLQSTDFLQACTLLYTRERRLVKESAGATGKELPRIECNRNALLNLPLSEYQKYADVVETGFIEASKFLNELKIIWHKDVPYPPLIVALASIFALLNRRNLSDVDKEKLKTWFWAVSLGELYGSSTESRLSKDVPEIYNWIIKDEEHPRSLDEAIFQQKRLRSLRSRRSAAYKSIYALMMHEGCRDFITGRSVELTSFFDDQIDIHHIFPVAWCKKNGIKPEVYNSIVNKTPLSKMSNISIGGDAPSAYLKKIEDKKGIAADRLDEILKTHLINPELLRNDDFEAFFESRMNALSGYISQAMKKDVVMETGSDEKEIEVEEFSFDLEENETLS
ncbi:DUF262 domain-containing protein [Pleurocapsales cyanobacterium LEGE 10410]|nr:DUF262 domain-containing protein [Pleurocapsales cyanobacterium LEGE 10410]